MLKKIDISETVVSSGEFAVVGCDAHLNNYVCSEKHGHSNNRPSQSYTHEDLIVHLKKLKEDFSKVYVAYEAGCFGFVLCRQLRSLGIDCLVVAQDENGGKTKTDKRDSRKLCSRLYSYVTGDQNALCECRVPTEQEEMRRARQRVRPQLQKMRQQATRMGKSLCLEFGLQVPSNWWKDANWDNIKDLLPEGILGNLESLRQMCLQANQQEQIQEEKQTQETQLPQWSFKGLGIKLWSIIATEIVDFERFNNRRQVSSFTGAIPGVHESNGKGKLLSITKQGNRRLRRALVELAHLVIRWQPDYKRISKQARVLLNSKSKSKRAAKKKAVIALARKLAIDIWRFATGKSTPEQMGLIAHIQAH